MRQYNHIRANFKLDLSYLCKSRKSANCAYEKNMSIFYHISSNISKFDRKVFLNDTKLQLALWCIMELERHLGAMCDNRFLYCECIQLGLGISVAGEHGVSASGFPFMMVLLALIAIIIPGTYEYYMFSA